MLANNEQQGEKDPPLAGFQEKAKRAATDNPRLGALIFKRQAHVEFQEMLKNTEKQLSTEEYRKLLMHAYRGTDLVFLVHNDLAETDKTG